MIADIVQAEGAPCPTLVVDSDQLPSGSLASSVELAALQKWLQESGRGRIRKVALYGKSADAAFDLDYRFVQRLADGADFRAGCGHSLLAAAVSAGLPGRVRVRAVTTGDPVVCEPEPGGAYTVRLERAADVATLLPTGRPVDRLCGLSVSIVRYGNPYVFIDARLLGLTSEAALFAARDDVLGRLLMVRTAAARRLGLPVHGALPKIAVVGSYTPGRLSVRAVTVTGWHPSLALTGSTCLAAATVVPGCVPSRLMTGARGRLTMRTPRGDVQASSVVRAGRLRGVSVHGKRARVLERAVPLPWRIQGSVVLAIGRE
ncbi:2-methylaconitate cis-trans-isomerase PrpF [Streptomyces sp. LBL]|uniref:PrpF domain-containing protein n=1 Tax=Streptomyces sp. LBL TaxID=2940562 RepID=UPI00247340B6|nr:PrpF domain-containing protein [Streptomyces sp. LBL]MDH6630500.1 2-methylaconitate cis-trans-isomerase PrpF [Streptomyces sp. LBL]